MHSLLGVHTLHTREERRTGLQARELACQFTRSLRQQASDTPVLLLQPSDSKSLRRICLQVESAFFLLPPAIHIFSLPAHKIVVVPLQLFRC